MNVYRLKAVFLIFMLAVLSIAGCGSSENDETPPAVSIQPVPSPTTLTALTLSGTVEAGAKVEVTISSEATVGAIVRPSATTWETALSGLAEGVNTLTVTATDDIGNSRLLVFSIIVDTLPPSVTIEQFITPLPSGIVQTIGGTVETGAFVTVADSAGASLCEAVVDGDIWTCHINGLLSDTTLEVTAADALNNAQTVNQLIEVVDSVPELTVTAESPTKSDNVVVTGTVSAGAVVTAQIDTSAEAGEPIFPVALTGWEVAVSNLVAGKNLLTITASQGEQASVGQFILARDGLLPFVTSTEPRVGSLNVPLDSTIGVTFSELMDESSLVAGESFKVVAEGDKETVVAGTGSLDPADGRKYIFIPDSPLSPGETYKVTLARVAVEEGGEDLVARDIRGDSVAENLFSLEFTTLSE